MDAKTFLNSENFSNAEDLESFNQDGKLAKKRFVAGKKRYIYVNKEAIEHNAREGTNFPTILVSDERGKKFEFHAVKFTGLLSCGLAPGIQAKVFAITYDEIEAFIDNSAPPSFAFAIKDKKIKRYLKKTSRNIKNFMTKFLKKSLFSQEPARQTQ